MKDKALYLLAFLAGGCTAIIAVRAISAWKNHKPSSPTQPNAPEQRIEEYQDILEDEGYTPPGEPYVILDEEYTIEISDRKRPNYDLVHITRFEDGVYGNEIDCAYTLSEIKEMFGECQGEINAFFERSPNNMVIFVRNPLFKTDFELVRDLRSYADILNDPTTRPEARFYQDEEE
jgi:hypothetical protein